MGPRRRWFPVLLAAVAATTVVGCGEPADDRLPGPDLIDDAAPDTVGTIAVDDDGFDPERFEVTSGDGVVLINEGDGPHSFDGGEAFNTGVLLPGEQTTLALVEPDEYEFVDGEQPDHEGVLVVLPDDG